MLPVLLEPGQIIRVRSCQYLVEDVTPPILPTGDTRVRLACLEDDAQGDTLEVFWEREIDAQVLEPASWKCVASRGCDKPRYFSAYLHALSWNCFTFTNPKLFQALYRAGIEVKSYQLESLRKVLRMPRVNLFITDDVGLEKTIEAGLILREMLTRQKISGSSSLAPSVGRQWKDEKVHTSGDVEDVLPHLKRRATELTERAKRKLEQRGEKESTEMKSLLEEQRDRILKQVKQYETQQLSLFNADKIRQLTQITAIEKNEWLN